MARKERNDVDYFPHTVNHGKKMFFIENKYGNDGYSTWFKVLEELGKASYHYLNLNDDMTIMFLSATCRVSVERLNEILDDLNKLGEFDSHLYENKVLFNERFVESINDAYKKRNNTCVSRTALLSLLALKGVLNGAKSNPNGAKGVLKGDGNTQSKVEYSKVKESKEEREPAFLNHSFKKFWDLYDKKRGDLAKIEMKWNNLSDHDRDLIIAYIPKYIAS